MCAWVYKILSYIIINVYPVLLHVYCSARVLVVLFIFHYSCVFYLTVSSLTCCFCLSLMLLHIFFGCACIPRSSVKTKYERTITKTKKLQNLWTRITFQYAYMYCFYIHTPIPIHCMYVVYIQLKIYEFSWK